jgi:ribosome recycling factor
LHFEISGELDLTRPFHILPLVKRYCFQFRRDGVDSIKKLAKDKEMGVSEDQEKDALDAAQKLTDKYIKRVDEIVATKEKDIMKV